VHWWQKPAAGDIVWCYFPAPNPKPRPVLVMTVFEESAPHFEVSVAYGTSQKTDRLFSGEFVIRKMEHLAAFAAAGLSLDTKFDLGELEELPFNSNYFAPPPNPRFGHNPKLGILHPSMMQAVQAAHSAISD
jgi:hypothetical protein